MATKRPNIRKGISFGSKDDKLEIIYQGRISLQKGLYNNLLHIFVLNLCT